jgi:hypothetical protein
MARSSGGEEVIIYTSKVVKTIIQNLLMEMMEIHLEVI